MRSFVVCYLQRVRGASEQKIPYSLAPGCFGQIGRPCFQDSTSCTNAAHIFGELQLIKQMPLMIIFYFSAHLLSLPSRGAWIEMRRGLFASARRVMSLPSRGAWIEIIASQGAAAPGWGSLPSRGAWIEILPGGRPPQAGASLPSRGAWIEIHVKWVSSSMPISRSPRGERG